MELVKKLCTAMLLLCLSLVVMVGTAYADDCDLEPSAIIPSRMQLNENGVYVQLVKSKDSKVPSNVRIETAINLEPNQETFSFEAVGLPVTNVLVSGRQGPPPQEEDLEVFPGEGGRFTSFTVSAAKNSSTYLSLIGICAD